MSETTGISWTDATWNCWQGCTKVSPGCAHCYMFREKARYGQDPTVVVRSAPATFNKPLTWSGDRIPGNGRGLVFTCSWSDFFHEAADPWRDEAWAIIRATPHLTYQILTKRADRIAAHLPFDWGGSGYANVWLGVSVETTRQVERAEILAELPARVRFLSCEPLLGAVALPTAIAPRLHWIIAGGETGAQGVRRELDLAHLVALYGYARAFDIPFHAKQDSGPVPGCRGRINDPYWVHEFPRALAARALMAVPA